MTPSDLSERDDERERNDGLPPYASANTHRLNWNGDPMKFYASLAADRREWEQDQYGGDER